MVTMPCKNPEDVFVDEHPLQAITEVTPPAVDQNQELHASRTNEATTHQATIGRGLSRAEVEELCAQDIKQTTTMNHFQRMLSPTMNPHPHLFLVCGMIYACAVKTLQMASLILLSGGITLGQQFRSTVNSSYFLSHSQ